MTRAGPAARIGRVVRRVARRRSHGSAAFDELRRRAGHVGDALTGDFDAELVQLQRIVATAAKDADLLATGDPSSMLSPAEQAVLFQLVRMTAPPGSRVAELGAYTGGTTAMFGEALRRNGARKNCLEVYDFFEHNATSRRKLQGHPHYNEHDFFDIWAAHTAEYVDLVELHRGDLRDAATDGPPLWMLYVDIVKSAMLIDPVMQRLLPRLRPGGLLVHQDYFHWQSPWVVYATEAVIAHFDVVGTVSNHMLVLRQREQLPDDLLTTGYVDGIDWDRKDELMQRAIRRFPGLRAGLLRVSRLNLMSNEGIELPVDEIEAIRVDHAENGRVLRYLDAALGADASSSDRPVW